jgi:galactokinase
MGAEAANIGAMSDWQRNIFSGAQQLGAGLGQAQQGAFDYLSRNMGEILNLQNTQRSNRQAYEQSLYDAAVQNAQSQNASKAGMITAGAGLGGAAIGAAAIII